MIELLVLLLAIVGIILFNENRTRLKRAEKAIFDMRADLDALRRGGIAPQAAIADGVAAAAEAAPDDAAAMVAETAETPETAPDSVPAEPVAVAAEAAPETVSDKVPDPWAQAASAKAAAPQPARSLESRLGAQWTVWVGGIALALGGLFVVRYSIEQGLLSPAVRVVMAALFGFALMAAGEIVRRRTPGATFDRFGSAMVPGVLTAAGSLTLMGAVYAAHNFYGFIASPVAFTLFGTISLATLGLSLRHGQTMAGLGMLASLVTPLLVISSEPAPWGLFGFLTVSWLGATAASRIMRWHVVPALANLGLGGWAVAYILGVENYNVYPPLLALLVMVAGLAFIWPADDDAENNAGQTLTGLLGTFNAPSFASAAFMLSLAAIAFTGIDTLPDGPAHWAFVAVILAMLAIGSLRNNAGWMVPFAAFGALAGFAGMVVGVTSSFVAIDASQTVEFLAPGTVMRIGALVAVASLAAYALLARRALAERPALAIATAISGVIVPAGITAISYVNFGNFSRDFSHGLFALVFAAAFLALALISRRREAETPLKPSDVLSVGHFLALIGAVLMMASGLETMIALSVIALAWLILAERVSLRLMPWFTIGAAIVVAGRIGWDPTLVGAQFLSATPVFNQLTIGYGVPMLAFAFAAYRARRGIDPRVLAALEAMAALFVLVFVGIEIRHIMQDGKLEGGLPTLAEQSLYTLLAIGASAVMMALDFRRGSPVFRWGSMGIAGVSLVMVLTQHLFTLNPYFSGELTGSLPVINLLLIGYLLPGIGYAALAWFACDRRPLWFVRTIALSAAAMGFLYVTLSVRRVWQGESIADWKGFLQGETYTYSAVWLALGVALLLLGFRFRALSIRLASAVLVVVAVAKVFLIDMANLEGLWRAASFIGLGGVLIGIGLLYQKILMGKPAAEAATEPEPSGEAKA